MNILSHRILKNNIEHCIENVKEISQSSSGIEIDVHLSKDNILVLNHDQTTYTKTGIVDDNINNYTWIELCEKYPNKYFKLEQLLDNHIDDLKVINIELKTYNYDYQNIEKYLLTILDKYNQKDKFIISSFNVNTLKKLNELNCIYKIGYLFDQMWLYNQFNKSIKYDYLIIDYHCYIDNQNYFSQYDLNIILWTVNDYEIYKYILNKTNVNYIISDIYNIDKK